MISSCNQPLTLTIINYFLSFHSCGANLRADAGISLLGVKHSKLEPL